MGPDGTISRLNSLMLKLYPEIVVWIVDTFEKD